MIEELSNALLKSQKMIEELKEMQIRHEEHLREKRQEYEQVLESNKHRKLIGFDNVTFEPIYEQ